MAITVLNKAAELVEITETKTATRKVSKPFLVNQIALLETRLNAMKAELASITTEIDKAVEPIGDIK